MTFELPASLLAYHDRDMNLVVHDGSYELRVGRSAADVVATGTFDIGESKAVPCNGRAYFVETHVEDA